MKNILTPLLNRFRNESVKQTGKYPAIIEEIHNEFMTSADKLLKEAMGILQKASYDKAEKVNRLKSAGFSQVPEVIDGLAEIEKVNVSGALAGTIEAYRLKYPNNKFITTEQVDLICKKYNLVCGPTTNFTGFVPDRNLRDIERFKLNSVDLIKFTTVTDVEFSSLCTKADKKRANEFLKNKNRFVAEYESQMKNEIFGGTAPYYGIDQLAYTVSKNDTQLFICAPEKDFKFDKKLKKGFRVSEMFKVNFTTAAPDPVVLKEVKGGYLIVTAWGDEASDELVVNHSHN